MCDGCICIILLFLSKISCYQHIHADTDPDRRCIHQCCNRECQRNSDQCILTQPCHKRAVYQVIGILQEHGNQRRYRHLPDEFSNRSDRHFIIGLHTFPPLHKVSGSFHPPFCQIFQYADNKKATRLSQDSCVAKR